MDFRKGGFWLYPMVGTEGQKHWAQADFQSVTEGKEFRASDAFCDSDGNINNTLPLSIWRTTSKWVLRKVLSWPPEFLIKSFNAEHLEHRII